MQSSQTNPCSSSTQERESPAPHSTSVKQPSVPPPHRPRKHVYRARTRVFLTTGSSGPLSLASIKTPPESESSTGRNVRRRVRGVKPPHSPVSQTHPSAGSPHQKARLPHAYAPRRAVETRLSTPITARIHQR